MEALDLIQKVVIVFVCLYLSWRIIRYIWSFLDVEKDPVIVLVTGAAGMFLINYEACLHNCLLTIDFLSYNFIFICSKFDYFGLKQVDKVDISLIVRVMTRLQDFFVTKFIAF